MKSLHANGNLQQAEIDVLQRVSALPIDTLAMAVASNIWRASQRLKSTQERTVLRDFELTWASFSTLFIVWVWGPIETRDLAASQGVTRGTVTSNVSQLEKRGLCLRRQSETDRRLVLIELTDAGRTLIEQVFPRFNQGEQHFAAALSQAEQETLVHLLRKLIQGNNEADASV